MIANVLLMALVDFDCLNIQMEGLFTFLVSLIGCLFCYYVYLVGSFLILFHWKIDRNL